MESSSKAVFFRSRIPLIVRLLHGTSQNTTDSCREQCGWLLDCGSTLVTVVEALPDGRRKRCPLR